MGEAKFEASDVSIEKGSDNMKTYVDVVVLMKSGGRMTPLFIVHKGIKYKIDRVSHSHELVSNIASKGIRYKIVVLGMERTLEYEGDGVWSIEGF